MQDYREGKLDKAREWNDNGGRPPVMPIEILEEKMAEHLEKKGKSMDENEMRGCLQDFERETIQKRGYVPVSMMDGVSFTTVRNYTSLTAHIPGVSVSRSAIRKTPTRETSENSIRSVTAFMAIVGATHYQLKQHLDSKMYKHIENASKGAKTFFDIVSKVYDNMPLQCVKPSHVTTSNDCGTFAFSGTNKKARFYLVSSESAGNCGTKSRYTTDEEKNGLTNGSSAVTNKKRNCSWWIVKWNARFRVALVSLF